MSEVRDRFATRLNGGAPVGEQEQPSTDAAEAGSIELF
jgi:hypothetical protein